MAIDIDYKLTYQDDLDNLETSNEYSFNRFWIKWLFAKKSQRLIKSDRFSTKRFQTKKIRNLVNKNCIYLKALVQSYERHNSLLTTGKLM